MRGVVLALLAALAIQNCIATVLVRYAKRDVHKTEQFHNSSVVLHQEILKLIISTAIVIVETHKLHYSGGNGCKTVTTTSTLNENSSVENRQTLFRMGNSNLSLVQVDVDRNVEGTDKGRNEKERRSLSRFKDRLKSIFSKTGQVGRRIVFDVLTKDLWRLFIPAFLYTAQSILGFLALNSLDPVTYQCFSQVKMLFVTVISVVVLRRLVHPVQWASLLMLTIGLVLIPLGKQDETNSSGGGAGRWTTSPPLHVEWYGVLCVLASCLASSYASIYLEWVMTSLRSTTIAARNVQLSLFGIVFACISLYVLDIRPNWIAQSKAVDSQKCHLPVHYNIFTRREGFHSASAKWPSVRSGCVHPFYVWERFDRWSVWAVIVVQSIGGLLIGFTMALSDSVMKSLSSALSTVLSALVAYAKHDFDYSWVSFCGGVLSLFSSYLFNVLERERKRAKPL